MSYLSWNCRGLGNPQTEDELVALVNNKDPKLAFLMETKAKKKVLEKNSLENTVCSHVCCFLSKSGSQFGLVLEG